MASWLGALEDMSSTYVYYAYIYIYIYIYIYVCLYVMYIEGLHINTYACTCGHAICT